MTSVGTPGERVEVVEYSDIDSVSDRVTERQKQLVKEHLNAGLPDGHAVVWLPEFISKPGLEPEKGDDQVYVVEIQDYSADAYAARQPAGSGEYASGDADYLPKSWTIVFEPGDEFDGVTSAQTGLTGWSR